MAFCSQCGESVRDDAAFCSACGKPVAPAAGTSTAPAAPPSQATPSPVAPPPLSEPPVSDGGFGINTRALLIGGITAVAAVVIAVAAWFVWQQTGDDSGGVAIAVATTASTVALDPAEANSTSTTTSMSTSTTTTTTVPPTTTTLPVDLVADLEGTGVFVASGSTADQASLEQSVANARNHGWDLSVVAAPAEPENGSSPYAGSIAAELGLGTVVVVSPDSLGWVTQETQFYDGEFERAWDLIPPGSTESQAVDSFVRSVLGGPDSVGVMDPGSAYWLLLQADGLPTEFTFGDAGDIAFVGDWDRDGIATPGVWRQSTKRVHLRNSTVEGGAEVDYLYNSEGVVPVVGDFDGDGYDTVSFHYPDKGLVAIYSTPEAAVVASSEAGESVSSDADYKFGDVGDLAFAGDFDGDGIDTIGLFRPSTGMFYLKNTHAEGAADIEFAFGEPGDIPIAGDWTDQDGVDSVAVYRPSTGTFYFRYANRAGAADEILEFGVLDGLAVAGAFGLDRSG